MKKYRGKLSLLLVFVMVVSLCVSGCGKKEGVTKDGYADTLYLYNWTEYMSQDVLDLFEEEYGIKVVQTTYESNDEMLAKLVASKKGVYDIDDTYLDGAYDPGNEYTIPYMGTVVLTIGNKKMLDDLGVTLNTIDDLKNPALVDNVIIMDDNEGIVSLGLCGLGYDPLTNNQDEIGQVGEYMMGLNDNIKAYPTTADGRTMLARNEVAVGHIYGGDAAQAMEQNEDLEIVLKDEPVSLSVDCFVLLKGSKHKKEAELFIDFLLRPEISAMLTEEFPYISTNEAAKAELSEEILNNPACFLPEDLKDMVYFIDINFRNVDNCETILKSKFNNLFVNKNYGFAFETILDVLLSEYF
jgi:spermidine/putrescine-binding protein